MANGGKFGVKRLLTASGTLGVFDITSDTQVRLIVENAGVTNTIAVYGKIQGQNNFVLIDTVVGTGNKLIDVALCDFLDLEVITYDSLGNYVDLAGSGFTSSGGGGTPGQLAANVNVQNFPNPQNVVVTNSPPIVAGTPVVLNMSLAAAGTEYTLQLPDSTKKFSLNATGAAIIITFGWVSGGPVITIPKGCSYTVEGLLLTGTNRTIYLKSNTNTTIIEILSWV